MFSERLGRNGVLSAEEGVEGCCCCCFFKTDFRLIGVEDEVAVEGEAMGMSDGVIRVLAIL